RLGAPNYTPDSDKDPGVAMVTHDDDAEIERLAKLSALDYERGRRRAAPAGLGRGGSCVARLRIEAEQPKASDVFEGNAHDLLVAAYRGRYRPTPIQLRAAAIAIAYESPKLAVTAYLADADDFAARLGRAIARSSSVKFSIFRPIEGQPLLFEPPGI